MDKKLIILVCLVLISSLTFTSALAQNLEPPDTKVEDLADHVPGEVLIRFNPWINSTQAALRMEQLNLQLKREIPALGVKLVKLPPGLSVEEAINQISNRPGVEFVEPNYILQITALTQEEITDQWGLQKIEATQAWEIFNGQPKVPITLAAVDSGVDPTHNDLSVNMWSNTDEIPDNGLDDDNNGYIDDTWGWDFVNNDNDPFDDNLHGTAVSSVMAGDHDEDGVAGVCPWCQIMAVKVISAGGTGTLDVVANGIIYATNSGAKVINLSLAGIAGAQTLQDAVDYAWAQGSLVVAGAGNDGANAPMYPAGYANAMAIGSTGENDTHSCFSNYGEGYISVVAPGENILIAIPDQGYAYGSGTSLSTPYVAGLGGLLFSQNPIRSNTEVRSIIESTAEDLSPPGVDAAFGHGRINAYRAVIGDQSQIEPPDGLFSTDHTATGYAHARKLVRDSYGKLHMIWHTKEGTDYRIRYATSDNNGQTWNLEPDVFSDTLETYHPAVATDGQNLFVAIPSRIGVDQPYQILFTRRALPSGDWTQPLSLMGGSYDAVRPDLYFDPSNGKLHLVASSFDNAPYVYYQSSQDRGINWNNSVAEVNPSTGTEGANSNTRYATIHANGDNILIVSRTVNTYLFFTYYYMHSVRSSDGGQSWFDQFKISSYTALLTGEYGISLAGIGNRVYMGYEVGSNMYFRIHDGVSWSEFETLELGDSNNVNKWPTITQAEDGQAWLIFEVNGEQFIRHYDGSTWAAKESLGTGNYANLKLGTSGDKLEWVTTQCNGAPFLVSYDSRDVGSNPQNIPPTADFTYSTADLTASFTDTSTDSDGSIVSWSWDFGDGNNSNDQNSVHNYAAADTYTVSLTVTDNDGGSDTTSQSVTVNAPNMVPTASFTYTTTDISAFFTDTSTDSDGTIVSWYWDFGDGYSSTVQNPSHTFGSEGTYTVSLTATDNDGAYDTTSQGVTVTAPNELPIPDFTSSTSYLTVIFLDASTDSDGTITNWSWDFGDGNTSTEKNPSHNYAAAGTYTVKLEVTDDDGAKDSVSKDVSVTEPPNAPPIADFTFSTSDLSVNFTDASTDSGGTLVSWYWNFGDGNTSTLQNPSHTYAAAGTYTVTLTATDDGGGSDSISKFVTVTDPPTIVENIATGEIYVAGSVSGDYTDTHEDGGSSEAIMERDSGGKPANRYSYLEHKWIFDITPGNVVTLFANAWSSDFSYDENFIFAYSTDDTSYIEMFMIDNDSHPGYIASYTLPASTQGILFVRVTDSDHNAGHRDKNAIYVDHIYIRSETQAGDPPAAPTSLDASAVAPTQVNLSWTDNSLDEYGFQVDRSLDETNWFQIDLLEADTNNYIDTTVSPNTKYFYRIRAFNGSGSSSYTNTASAITPNGLALQAIGYKIKGEHTVDLTWSGDSASTFNIYRNGSQISSGIDSYAYTDSMQSKGGASYLYQVCETGNPLNCSNTVQVDF